MFELDENIPGTACTVKVAGIGKTRAALENFLIQPNITQLTEDATAPESWTETGVGFLVADASENNAWDNVQKALQTAEKQNVLSIPIWIAETPPRMDDAIMWVNPKNFASDAELYDYIGESILSIQSIISQPGLVNLDLEDIRGILNCPGRLSFTYGEYTADADKRTAIQQAMQKLTAMDVAPGSSKFMILNITGSEDHLSMFEICEISELIHDDFGTDDCSIIWGATIDNALADKIRISLWLKY